MERDGLQGDREFILSQIMDNAVDGAYHNRWSFLEKEINGRTIEIKTLSVSFKD